MKFCLLLLFVLSPVSVWSAEKIKGTETAILTDAPSVPPPIKRKYATKVIVNLEVREVQERMADGVQYTFWTFGGKVPGKFIRIREGDQVEFHLNNHANNKMPHNIDLHAVTGQGGGAAASLTAPGHSSVFSFKALNPGLYVYHCATAPVAMHVANGMYGLILVEPKKGLSKVDREYYVMQGDFYTKGPYGQAGLQPFSMEKAIEERADYVVFNGSVGSLVGDKAITAKTGEKVRLFVGNGGPNLTSAFHVIGEIFDEVWAEGNTNVVTKNVQTTVVPPGGSAIAQFKVDVPGTYILVDHALTRAFNKGALGMLKVTGAENKVIYSGKLSDEVYMSEGSGVRQIKEPEQIVAPTKNKAERVERGQVIYSNNCVACHQSKGEGIENVFPPLAGSDLIKNYKSQAIDAVANGLQGPIKVNGKVFNGVMPAWDLSDEDIANVLTYVYNSWGNPGDEITPGEVALARKVKK